MPATSVTVEQARTFSASLKASDPALAARLDARIAEATRSGSSRVDLSWLPRPALDDLEARLRAMRSDGFSPADQVRAKDTLASGTRPDTAALITRTQRTLESVPVKGNSEARANAVALRRSLISEAEAMAAQPGQPALDRARLKLVVAQASGQVVAGVPLRQKSEPGLQAFHALQAAMSTAPEDVWVVRAALMSAYALKKATSGIGGIVKRPFVEGALHAKIDDVAKNALRLAAAPALLSDAPVQVTREQVAKMADDDASRDAARAAIAKISPPEVAAARATLVNVDKQADESGGDG